MRGWGSGGHHPPRLGLRVMGEASVDPGQPLFEPIPIRYDGKDAERHEIELSALADSLKGLSRILAVAGNFAATEK